MAEKFKCTECEENEVAEDGDVCDDCLNENYEDEEDDQ